MASRTRGQVRAREEEEQRVARPVDHVSPAMRIYRHALESIFVMLELEDLAQVLAVSRSCFAAVRSMKSINAAIERDAWHSNPDRIAFRPLPPVVSLVTSPLLRHVSCIRIRHADAPWSPLDNASLRRLAHHVPNLTSLCCLLKLTANKPLIWPAKLTSLELQLDRYSARTIEYTDAAINGMLTTLTALPSLSRLHLGLAVFADELSIDLSLLSACPSEVLPRLLQPPVTARWQDLGRVLGDAHTGELLLTLPTLTKLELALFEDTSRLDFLSQLPHLTALDLICYKSDLNIGPVWHIPADALLASLLLCTGLKELSLACGFNSAHHSALFDQLTLRKLTVRRGVAELQTLQCFAAGPITQSLEELSLRGFALPLTELAHLSGLRRLRTLHLAMGSSRLPDATIDSLSPPTPLLPTLTELLHEGRDVIPHQWVCRKRQGPSFEWMQQRMTQ